VNHFCSDIHWAAIRPTGHLHYGTCSSQHPGGYTGNQIAFWSRDSHVSVCGCTYGGLYLTPMDVIIYTSCIWPLQERGPPQHNRDYNFLKEQGVEDANRHHSVILCWVQKIFTSLSKLKYSQNSPKYLYKIVNLLHFYISLSMVSNFLCYKLKFWNALGKTFGSNRGFAQLLWLISS
jgi:hypothetical protein